MRTTSTMTISLPPAMVEEFEKVRKAENRTKSELVREALRQYFSSRFPAVSASKAELAAIKRGRAAFARGEYVSLDDLIHDVKPGRCQARPKGSRRPSRKRKRAD